MTRGWVSISRTILAIVLGELSLVVLTTVAQEVVYDGISYTNSPIEDIFFGGFLTVLAAVFAEIVAVYAGGRRNFWPHVFISLIIGIEMTYLITSGLTKDPLWFDVIAGSSLVVVIWIGFVLRPFLITSR